MKRLILVMKNEKENEMIEISWISPKGNGWYSLENSPVAGLVAGDAKISFFNGNYYFWKRSNIPSSARMKIDNNFELVRGVSDGKTIKKYITYKLIEIKKEVL